MLLRFRHNLPLGHHLCLDLFSNFQCAISGQFWLPLLPHLRQPLKPFRNQVCVIFVRPWRQYCILPSTYARQLTLEFYLQETEEFLVPVRQHPSFHIEVRICKQGSLTRVIGKCQELFLQRWLVKDEVRILINAQVKSEQLSGQLLIKKRLFILHIYIRHIWLTKKARRSACISLFFSVFSSQLFLGDRQAFSIPLWLTSVFLMALTTSGANSFANSLMLNWPCSMSETSSSFPLDDCGTCV